MKELTVNIQDEYEGKVIYRTELYTEEEYKKLEEENKKLKEKNEKLEEDNINLISFNEHYSPDVIVKYEDRYETAYNEECIENAKLCDKMRRLEEENKKLKEDGKSLESAIGDVVRENRRLKEENKKLKFVIDTLMEKTGIENIKLATGEVFLNPKKRLKLNTDFMEKDTLQELRDLGKI